MNPTGFGCLAILAGTIAVSVPAVAVATEPTPQGPAAVPTLSHRTVAFHMRKVPQNSASKDLVTLTFKAARSGPASVLARGYCNLDMFNAASTKEVDLDLHLSTVTAFSSDVDTWGVAREVPQTAANVYSASNWTALREFPAVMGTQYSIVLSAYEVNSTSVASDCSGTVTLDIVQ